jgi:hypothetical protein
MRDMPAIDDAPQHLAPTSSRRPIKANCMNFADWQPSDLRVDRSKKFWKFF